MANTSEGPTLQWQRADGTDPTAELTELVGDYAIEIGPPEHRVSTYVDTVDWRLRTRGLTLRHDEEGGTLVLGTPQGEFAAAVAEAPQWPALLDAIPNGEVRDRATAAFWIRAVDTVLRIQTTSRVAALSKADGEIVVCLDVVEARGLEPKTPTFIRLFVRPVPGHEKDAKRVGKALLRHDAVEKTTESVVDALLSAAGLPLVVETPTFDVSTPADVAVAQALLGFADAITGTVDGVVADVDTEFLHDMRVAVRRTRSMLKLVGDVLPFDTTRYVDDFRLLGDITTPTRDLDVYLLELPELAASLTVGHPDDLGAFREHIEHARAREYRVLVRSLRSKRFAEFFADWRADLRSVVAADAPDDVASPNARKLARKRIRRIYKKVVGIAETITPDSESAEVHSLRKRCKELRYLLEFFAPICEPDAHRAAIKDLKQLQDILGNFQDGEMQSTGLRRIATHMLEGEKPPAATLLAMGELSARFGRQQQEARDALAGQLERYLGAKAHARIEAMLP